MPSNFDDELHPRSALAISDAEIEEVFTRAQKESGTKSFFGSRPGLEAVAFDFVILFLALYLVLAIATSISSFLLLVSLLVLLVPTAWLLSRSAIPIGWFTYQLLKEKQKQSKSIRTDDVHVLAVVVAKVAGEPIRYSQELHRRIQKDREEIATSLQELDTIEHTLRQEIKSASDESMRLLLESRRGAALRATEKLQNLDRQLAEQLREVSLAVAPVVEMEQRFESLKGLNSSLSKIQSAHGLAESGAEAVAQQKLEIQVLRSVSQEATVKLQEIQQLLESQERAKAELDV